MEVWDEEQVRLFLAEARRSSGLYPLYLVAVMTGMRQAELAGLRWSDVDLVTGTAVVCRSLYRLGRRVVEKEPKSASWVRSVPLPPLWCGGTAKAAREKQGVAESVGAMPLGEGLQEGLTPGRASSQSAGVLTAHPYRGFSFRWWRVGSRWW